MDKFGSIVRINLTTGSIKKESLCEKTMKEFIGGRGYATKVLYDELPKGTDPLSPASPGCARFGAFRPRSSATK